MPERQPADDRDDQSKKGARPKADTKEQADAKAKADTKESKEQADARQKADLAIARSRHNPANHPTDGKDAKTIEAIPPASPVPMVALRRRVVTDEANPLAGTGRTESSPASRAPSETLKDEPKRPTETLKEEPKRKEEPTRREEPKRKEDPTSSRADARKEAPTPPRPDEPPARRPSLFSRKPKEEPAAKPMASVVGTGKTPSPSREETAAQERKAAQALQQPKAPIGAPILGPKIGKTTVEYYEPAGQADLRQHFERVRPRLATAGYTKRVVLDVPPLPPNAKLVQSQELVPGRAVVRLYFDESTHSHVYEVIEPKLIDPEQQILAFVRDTLLRTLDGSKALSGHVAARETLLEGARQAIVDHAIVIDEIGLQRVEYYLERDFLGYGPVDILMRDPMIEDISCDGPQIPIYLFHRQHESVRTSVKFEDDLELDAFVIRLAQRSGKHISVAEPLLDATLPDGSRLQSTLAREVTTRGSSFTIRKFRANPMTPADLVRVGTMSAELAAYFWMVIEHGHSFILAGGTASGKTTSLNAICQFIPPQKKIVSIEDTREINLNHENWIAGLTRSGFGGELVGGKPAGTIDMYRLLEAALRQRPEYLLVGEVRGPEALTLFQAMATGHAVYSTMHADSVASAVYRLENPPIHVPRIMLQTMDLMAIQGQSRVKGRMARRIKDVVEMVGMEPDSRELLTNTVFEWDSREDKHRFLGKSHILEQIMDYTNRSEEEVMSEWRQRVEIIEWMVRTGMSDYREVSGVVASYYRDPATTLTRVRGP